MTTVYDFSAPTIDGQPQALDAYRGQVLLIVNVASKCGLTVQYEGLEKLYADKRERGFVIAGFPANDFKGQEPGTDAEILDFCTSTFGVDFPMFSKISVKGPDKHPLYKTLTNSDVETTGEGPMRERLKGAGLAGDDNEILWNFEKFLVGRNGKVVARFAPDVTADDSRLVSAIDRELAKAI
jgi:glutathione peroxidase